MTRQEAFDRVWHALQAQSWRPSLGPSGDRGAYRGVDGLKCSVGHLITDEEAQALGPHSIYDALMDLGIPVKSLAGLDVTFLRMLQGAHDTAARSYDPIPMEQGLRDVAGFFRLKVPE